MFKWHDKFSVNIEEIDKQHQKLFELGSRIFEMVSVKGDFDYYDEIIEILTELKEYTIYHFGYEEKLMAETGFEGLEEHKKEHDAFVSKVEEVLKKDIDEEQREIKMDMIIFIADWVEKHILNTDQEYKIYLNLKGVF